MDVKKAIENRRALRSLAPAEISEELIHDLAQCASLAPSCYNHQPWRFVFVFDKKKLAEVFGHFIKGNNWAKKASMLVAVFTKKEFDCVVKKREYAFFDTGLATALLILRATELNLVAHPIAGYDELEIKHILNISENATLITIVVIGKLAESYDSSLSASQIKNEKKRPERFPLEQFVYLNEVKE